MSGAETAMLMQMAGQGTEAIGGAANSYAAAHLQRAQSRWDVAAAAAEASDAQYRGRGAEVRALAAGNRRTASIRQAAAGRGFATDVGTAAQLQDASDWMAQLDAATIRENTEKEVTAAQMKEVAARWRGRGANPRMAALGSLIGGAGQVASTWYQS